ncbi:trans-aconitate 2-methyltransferase [uncultured Aeromicrobium sp.]|uniref:class I SAM-dependent methyltransferase n=1 Tax=uncultured Aeromicrobium sp. TaxID=337820 RepID=UPI0025F08C99|nr:class I SAM-dependent methyltransferase [uncultured Aeromicrobium sp.]
MSADTVETLIRSWDDQQAAYIAHREQRFAVMLEAIEHLLTGSPTFGSDGAGLRVLDLACGPGSLSQRILARFPAAHVIGVDVDPVLLHLARTWLNQTHPGRFTAVDADLVGDWRSVLPAGEVQVAVSSTALHWLSPDQLVAVYAELGRLLPAGGLFLNADHLRYDPRTQPFLTAGAAENDGRTQQLAYASGALTWDQWWQRAIVLPEIAELAAERERRFADRPPTADAPLELHLSALRTAGFEETGVLWRFWDDIVVLARR